VHKVGEERGWHFNRIHILCEYASRRSRISKYNLARSCLPRFRAAARRVSLHIWTWGRATPLTATQTVSDHLKA
jgi:hypothetical protein